MSAEMQKEAGRALIARYQLFGVLDIASEEIDRWAAHGVGLYHHAAAPERLCEAVQLRWDENQWRTVADWAQASWLLQGSLTMTEHNDQAQRFTPLFYENGRSKRLIRAGQWLFFEYEGDMSLELWRGPWEFDQEWLPANVMEEN